MNRHGQTAVEFLVLLGFMTLVFTLFLIVVSQRTAFSNEQARYLELRSIGETIEQEVSLAYRVAPGYARTFELPLTVDGKSYVVDLRPLPPSPASEVIIRTDEFEYVLFLPVNVSFLSNISPGYNAIVKPAEGNITIRPTTKPVFLPPPSCTPQTQSIDCDDGNACTADTCVSGSCTNVADDKNSCSDGLSCTSDVCSAGSCIGTSTCAGGVACLPTNGGICESFCTDPLTTNIRYLAGNGSGVGGTNWSEGKGALSRDPFGEVTNVCCVLATHCVVGTGSAGGCVTFGSFPANQVRLCEDAGLGGELLNCNVANDGKHLTGVAGRYCCSRFSVDPDGAGSLSTASYGFNKTVDVNKSESLAVVGSCTDGSDNDCDGFTDGFSSSCWSVKVNSTCGYNTTNEDVSSYVSGAGSFDTQYTHDWRMNGVSIAHLLFSFDVENSGGAGKTRDYSKNALHGTLQGALWVPSSGSDSSGSIFFDGVNDAIATGMSFGSIYDNFTIAFWANPSATRASTVEATSGITGTSGQRYAVYPTIFGSGNDAGAGVSVGENGVSVFEHAGGYLPSLLVYNTVISGWTHVAVVYTAKRPSLYLDGVLVRTAPLASTKTVHPGSSMGDAGTYGPYSGYLDEVMVFNRSLSPAQIVALASGKKSTVKSSELKTGEIWTDCVTPNNGSIDFATVCGNNITIKSGSGSDVCLGSDSK